MIGACTCIVMPPTSDRGGRVIYDPWCPNRRHRARAVESPDRG